MAVEQISEWRVTNLPATPVVGRKYNKKAASDTGFRPFITNSAGVAVPLDAPTVAEMTSGLAGKENTITPGAAGTYFGPDKTWLALNKAAVGLGNVDNTSDLLKPLSTATINALALKADDNAVVKLTGNQTVAGIKTFSSSPVVPNATTATQAAAYGQVTTADAALQTQIDNLVAAVSGGMKSPLDIDCSANPNYPAAVKGDNYMVTVAGRIGGATGPEVEVGDWIINKANSAAGNHATVGASWFIVQRNTGLATEALIGMLRKATQAESETGTSDVGAMTPLKTAQQGALRYVRFDAAQTLTEPNKTQARANIGAISTADLATYATITGSDAKYVRYDAAQTLTEPQKAQGRSNLGVAAAADVNLQAVLTGGNSATNQTITVQGVAASSNYIARFGASTGWVEMFNATAVNGNFVPGLRGTSVGAGSIAGLYMVGQGSDAYSQGAFLMSGRNAAGTGEITSGNLLSVRNFTSQKFSVGFDGAVAASGVISAVVGNSTQWNLGYLASTWNDAQTPEW